MARRRTRSGWCPPTKEQTSLAIRSGNERSENDIPLSYRSHPGCFTRLSMPRSGEWLDDFNEKGQSMKQFERLSFKAIPHGHCNIIEIIPVGPFGPNSPNINQLCLYASIFFGCEVRVSKKVLSLMDVCKGKNGATIGGPRCGGEGQLQLDCADIFNTLAKDVKMDRKVLCRVVITMADLYCVKDGEAWNFLFGQARASDGIGVFSFARYNINQKGEVQYPLMWEGLPTNHNYTVDPNPSSSQSSSSLSCAPEMKIPIAGGGGGGDSDNVNISISSSNDERESMSANESYILKRSCKVLTHETGHLFGLKHCIYYECLMQGSNSSEESDRRTMQLCPICLRKLQSSIKFDPLKRSEELGKVYQLFGWKDEYDWNEKWASYVQ